MKKRIIAALLLTTIGTMSALAGCGAMPSTDQTNTSKDEPAKDESSVPDDSSSSSGDGKTTLRVVDWSDGSAGQREAFHKKYMEEHPDINIEYTMLTVDQFKNTIVTMIKSGEGPDLFPIPVGLTLNTAVAEGWFQPMNDFVTEDFAKQFDPLSFEEGVTHIGEDWYTVTEVMPTIQCLFFYNKDVLAAAGVKEIPATYSEFREACKKVTAYGKGKTYGLVDGGKQTNRMDVLARSLAAAAGGKIAATTKVLTDGGKAPYDTKEMKQALALLQELVDDGSIHPDTVNISAPEARELFAHGQAAFLCQGMWCISQWDADYPDMNYGVIPVPVPDGVSDTYVQAGELSPWMGIYKQSKHPKEAAEYLMALYSEEYGYQPGCVADGTFVSVIPSINEAYMSNPIMKDYYTIASETSKIVPTLVKRDVKANDLYAEIKDVQPSLGAIVQGILSKSITDYEAALKTLAEASTAEWKRASEAVGMDFQELEFPNWDVKKDYTEKDYEALK
ncbi:MAG: extracellular solute-binding protein [Eubacterium sp.]|nr:extracellular solute-binding protein [Eubacterium sp.]